MSRILCIATPKIKPTRRTGRPEAPFGQGLIKHTPFGGLVADPEAFEHDEDRRLDVMYREWLMAERLQRGPWL